jgi:hypothetical protein
MLEPTVLPTDPEYHLERLSSDIPGSNIYLESISQIVENTLFHEILKWVSPLKYEDAHNSTEKTALSGIGQWLLQHDKYVSWWNSTIPSTLWLHGFMGSGKSCLAHVVIEDIRTTTDIRKGDRYVFVYCDGTDSKSTCNTGNILRSFVKQLANSGNGRRLMRGIVETYNVMHHRADMNEQQSLDLIISERRSISSPRWVDGFLRSFF